MNFQMVHIDEETTEFFVNGQYVGEANYDELGRHGMNVVRELFSRVANAAGATVTSSDSD